MSLVAPKLFEVNVVLFKFTARLFQFGDCTLQSHNVCLRSCCSSSDDTCLELAECRDDDLRQIPADTKVDLKVRSVCAVP